MIRNLIVLSLALSIAMVAGCSKEDTTQADAEAAAKAAVKEAEALDTEIQQLIKDGKLDDAEKKLKELEGKPGLPDSWKATCKALRGMLDAARLGGGITLPKFAG